MTLSTIDPRAIAEPDGQMVDLYVSLVVDLAPHDLDIPRLLNDVRRQYVVVSRA